jgi:hypothetical protein
MLAELENDSLSPKKKILLSLTCGNEVRSECKGAEEWKFRKGVRFKRISGILERCNPDICRSHAEQGVRAI